MRILLLENQPISRRLARETLEAAGHDVTEYATGSETMVALELGGWDVLVLDLVMPGFNGFRLLGEGGHLLPPRVVVTTALAPAEVGRLPEGVRVLYKPYTPHELLAAVTA